ncbi:death-associated kinase 1-like [Pelobates cultripes]|uniref:Death-associated kinase 1-like n=1 Tax=Pelobates cultripes TaxID=61616 RepID=A0AAD1RNC4_PELCU|nr:death-associated kinase 1-like [Pelobates cultripes]
MPHICQEVMKQVRLLLEEKIRFQDWKNFSASVARGLSEPLCTNRLLTAVEYLHSELLYLPCCSRSTKKHTLNPDSSPNPVHTSQDVANDLSHNVSATCLDIMFCICPSGIPTPTGLVILDLPWLLQEIFGRFGNFLLSPASGREKECWSLSEVESALELQDGEGDIQTVLQLLETLELLLQTSEGYYVVPAWLKRGGPTEHLEWKNLKGVVYHWQETSMGLFNRYLIGQLQLWLLRQFGSHRCHLWREGAQCVAEAMIKMEISEDRRSLFVTGGWDKECSEGACYELLEMVGTEVECLLRKCQDQGWEKLHLIPRELFAISSDVRIDLQNGKAFRVRRLSLGRGKAEGLSGFSWEQILKAERECTSLYGKYVEAKPWEILFPQHDHRMLYHLGRKCSIRWLDGSTLANLCSMLDTSNPLGLDWKRLAQELGGASCSVVDELNDEAIRKTVSPTRLVIDKYSLSVEKLFIALKQMEREDCQAEIENMMKQL